MNNNQNIHQNQDAHPNASAPNASNGALATGGARRSMDWKTIAMIVGAIVLVLFAVWMMIPKPASHSSAAASSSSSAVASAPASQGTTAQASASPSASAAVLDEAEIQRARSRAHEFVTAYYSQSWKDPDPANWAFRAGTYSTPEFRQKMIDQASQQKADDPEWQRLVKARIAMNVQDEGEYVVFNQGTDESGAPMIKFTATLMVGRDARDPMEAVKPVREVKTIVLVRDFSGSWKVADYYNALGNNG